MAGLAISSAIGRETREKPPTDSGVYLFALELTLGRPVKVGSLSSVRFKKGWYVYVGSAKRCLYPRLARQMNKRKVLKWHIDFLRNGARVVAHSPFLYGLTPTGR